MEKIAYIDFDGTVVNAKVQMCRVWNTHFRPLNSPILDGREVTSWDGGVPHHIVEHIFAHKEFFNYQLEVFDGFEDAMEMLKDRGFKLVLYTKGSLKNISNKANWVTENYPDLFDGWHFIGTNNLEMGKSQLDMSVEDGYSILIDDHIKNLQVPHEHIHEHHMPTYPICCRLAKRTDEEWNKDFDGLSITHWNQLSRLIEKIDNYECNVIR